MVKTYPFLVLNGVFQAVYFSFNKNGVHIFSTSDKLSLFLYLMNPRLFLHEHLKEPVIFVDSRPNIAHFSMINTINLIVQTIICYFIALVFFRHRKSDSLKSIFLLILFGTSSSMSIPAKLRSLGIHANAGLFSMLSTMLRI